MFCFETDVLSAVLERDPPLRLIRRLATVPPEEQFTTSITLGELLFGASSRGSQELEARIRELVLRAIPVVVTGNVRHFSRIAELDVEDWLAD